MILPAGFLTDDQQFDELLPPQPRRRSRHYWTPVAVASLAAQRLVEHGARNVLDVGCGPGKFCLVAAAQCPELQLHGIDQRPELVATATELGQRLGITNASFAVGDATAVAWDTYDGLYFFNPFAENTVDAFDRYDTTVYMSQAKREYELLCVDRLLKAAPLGTVMVTYNGLGAPIPSSYELVMDEPAGTEYLRTWVRRRPAEESWSWIEIDGDGVGKPAARDYSTEAIAPDDTGQFPTYRPDRRRTSSNPHRH